MPKPASDAAVDPDAAAGLTLRKVPIGWLVERPGKRGAEIIGALTTLADALALIDVALRPYEDERPA